jgi:hypothetical protein
MPVQSIFCPALAALVSPIKNIIFFTAHLFTLLVPIAQQPGQEVVPGRLSLFNNLHCPKFKAEFRVMDGV